MQISVSVILAKGEDLHGMSPDEAAEEVIKAFKGDTETDFCTVHVSQPEPGSAGTPPPPPVPFFEQQMPPPGG